MPERLQKILAQAGIASRRGAEQLILSGRVKVNGEVVNTMGCKVDPACDQICCDDKPISLEKKIYILLHKPAGYVTTLSDPQRRHVVAELIADIPQRLFPVGRLDLDTEGALLMTNDGELGNQILHPRFEVKKTYEATVKGSPLPAKLRLLEQGIELDSGRTQPAAIKVLSQAPDKSLIQIIIHEGKKRQVRKMFKAVGHEVLYLKRTAYGNLRLGTLPSGKYRVLSQNDLKKIFSDKIPFTIKNIPA